MQVTQVMNGLTYMTLLVNRFLMLYISAPSWRSLKVSFHADTTVNKTWATDKSHACMTFVAKISLWAQVQPQMNHILYSSGSTFITRSDILNWDRVDLWKKDFNSFIPCNSLLPPIATSMSLFHICKYVWRGRLVASGRQKIGTQVHCTDIWLI